MTHTLVIADKDKIVSFLWQHCLLLISLFILTLGVALCIRSNLGSSVISSIPLAFTIAGSVGYVPPLSLGMYTNILNVLLVGAQIIILGRRMAWFDRLLLYRPGVRRYIYGLLRFLHTDRECPPQPRRQPDLTISIPKK